MGQCFVKDYSDDVDLFSFNGVTARCKVVHVVDGDTMDVIGHFNHGEKTKVRLRLAGVDAAEKNTEQGIFAKRLVEAMLRKCDGMVTVKFGSRNSKGRWQREKYGRHLASVFVDGKDLAQTLIQSKDSQGRVIAVKYDGGTKSGVC